MNKGKLLLGGLVVLCIFSALGEQNNTEKSSTKDSIQTGIPSIINDIDSVDLVPVIIDEESPKQEEQVVEPEPQPSIPQYEPEVSKYSCDCHKTCPNLTCEEAQYQLNTCGCSARDADHDGLACDNQCGQ